MLAIARIGAAALAAAAGLATAPGRVVVVDGDTCFVSAEPRHERKVSASAAHQPAKPFKVESGSGSIAVKRGGTDTVTVDATFRGSDEARLAQATIVSDRQADGTLLVTVKWPGKQQSNESTSLEITIPDTGSLALKTNNGSIRVEDLGGKATLDSGSGAIQVTRHAGAVSAHTDNGSIKVNGCDGNLAAKSGSGAISVERAGRAVDATTDNGSVRVSGCAGNLTAKSGSGSITVEGAKGVVKADTDNGNIQVRTCDGNLLAKSGSGSITVERAKGAVEVATDNGRVTVHGCDGTISAKSGSGAIGVDGAKASVDARTDNGSITVSLTSPSRGPVNAHTDSGSIDVALTPDFAGTVAAETESGRVDVRDVVGAKVEKGKRNSAKLVLGDGGGPTSTLRSGNGGITIRTTK